MVGWVRWDYFRGKLALVWKAVIIINTSIYQGIVVCKVMRERERKQGEGM